MTGRIRCWIDGHELELIAWDVRARTETWACSRCPFATSLTRRLGEHDKVRPIIVRDRAAWDFGIAVVGCLIIATAVVLLNLTHGRPF